MKLKGNSWFTYHCSGLSLCEFEADSWSIFTILLATQMGAGSPLARSPRVLWSTMCYSAHRNLDLTVCCLPGHDGSHVSCPCPKFCISELLWRDWSWSSLEPRKDAMVDLTEEGQVCWTEDIITTEFVPCFSGCRFLSSCWPAFLGCRSVMRCWDIGSSLGEEGTFSPVTILKI